MKTVKILFVFIIIIFILSSNVFASVIFERGREWLRQGEESANNGEGITFATSYEKLNAISGILMGVAIFTVIGCGMIIGMRYLLSGPEQRATLKRSMIGYAIGASLSLGALEIFRIVVRTLENAART